MSQFGGGLPDVHLKAVQPGAGLICDKVSLSEIASASVSVNQVRIRTPDRHLLSFEMAISTFAIRSIHTPLNFLRPPHEPEA